MIGLFAIAMILCIGIASAAERTSIGQQSVCCQKTVSGLFCQNVKASECSNEVNPNTGSPYLQAPTSCETTSYCRQGYCYDSKEGTCSDKVSELVCNANSGVWKAEKPAACELGCCVLGDQAAFVTLTRCKKLASFLGLNTNFKKNIKDEVSCVMSVRNQDKGACVYEFEFERVCKFTTRDECSTGVQGSKGEFFVGKLCSAGELATKCGPTTQTVCLPGREEVYFVDSCGNPANIYDSSKVNDPEYWTNYKDKSEACNPDKANENSASCGNCNYLLGSFCRDAKKAGASKPSYGDNICANLNCKKTSNGKSYKHGESWCVYDDKGGLGDAVGARFYKHICINGEEVLEQCADFKAEVCLQDSIPITGGQFSQAACRVNRWQTCNGQNSKGSCENKDARDCSWINSPQPDVGISGYCVPKYSPGLKFWEGSEAKGICKQASEVCNVVLKETYTSGDEYTSGEECLSGNWKAAKKEQCAALGDCAAKINWVGAGGSGKGCSYYNSEEGGVC